MAKTIEPNYDFMMQARINVAQNAYEEYKRAMHEMVNATWIGNDGSFWMYGFEEAHKKVTEKIKLFTDAYTEMIEFKKTIEAEKGDK